MLRALFAATALTLLALPALAQPPVLIVFFSGLVGPDRQRCDAGNCPGREAGE